MAFSPQPKTGQRAERRRLLGVCILLTMTVLVVFGRTLWYGFVNFDDDAYFALNPHVQFGLTWGGMKWAFQVGYANNWHPLTWWSLMLDAQLFGTGPWGPHLTNVLLHAANAVLLFLLLRRMTGALWPSAVAAAAFAIHPLRVESVAWISERKDVLSGLFFMLTLLVYAQYVRKSEVRSQKLEVGSQTPDPGPLSSVIRPLRCGCYWLAILFFALGLMSKPMLVTVPFVMLLLDYWPLGRMQKAEEGRIRGLIWEKLPFALLSAVACAMTLLAQREGVMSTVKLPITVRFDNALVSGATYILQMFWPANLCIFYPYRFDAPLWQTAGAGALLFGVSFLALLTARRIPCFPTGWFWYLGMLVPVIGLVQVGSQPHADRYTYLPHIGLCLLLTWAIRDSTVSWRHRTWIVGVVAATVIGILMVGAWRQTCYWRNSESLWAHALACTSENFTAHDYLGAALAVQGRTAEAIEQYRKALAIHPAFADAHNDLAEALFKEGRLDEAAEHFRRALDLNPRLVAAHDNLGLLLAQRGQTSEATEHFQKAVELDPEYVEAQNNLGTMLAAQGRAAEAAKHFQRVLEIMPDHAKAHFNLANVFASQGRWDDAVLHYERAAVLVPGSARVHYLLGVALERKGKFAPAIAQFEKVLELEPRHAPAQNNLAWLLATCRDASLRNGRRAVELARQPEELAGGKSAEVLDTLAAAYAEAGDFEKAVETAKRALSLITNQTNNALTGALELRLKLYEANTAYHERQ